MKRVIYLIALLTVISFAACEKESKKEPVLTECQKENIGYLRINNNSKHAFDVWINGKYYKQQPGNTYIKDIKLNAGRTYTIDVKQVAGYIFYPTEKSFNVTINMCDEKTVSYTN